MAATTQGVSAQPTRFMADAGLTLHHFQQQAKTEIGGVRGERLVEETALGLQLAGTYAVLDYLHVGLFTRLDAGKREAGAFSGFDEDGAAVTMGELGGTYAEWWLGPLARAQYRSVFLEVGWGALGLRSDGGRDDLPDEGGSTAGAFATTPAVAWTVALGGGVPLSDDLELLLRLQYRVRYYTTRGGRSLIGDAAQGSQDLTPFAGVGMRF